MSLGFLPVEEMSLSLCQMHGSCLVVQRMSEKISTWTTVTIFTNTARLSLAREINAAFAEVVLQLLFLAAV